MYFSFTYCGPVLDFFSLTANPNSVPNIPRSFQCPKPPLFRDYGSKNVILKKDFCTAKTVFLKM